MPVRGSRSRYFTPITGQLEIAVNLHRLAAELPLICPHTHVDPLVFADADYRFGSPSELLIIPDHYVCRLLYSQGVPLEALGVPRLDGGPVESDHRRIWQTFAEHYHLFRGTPTGLWLREIFETIFGITRKLTPATAQEIYDQLDESLRRPEFTPRRLYQRFKVEVLCTTDPATSTLEHHQAIRAAGWPGRILPTFRPDSVINLETPNFAGEIQKLSAAAGIAVTDYWSYIRALEQRRAFFKTMGATATDHAVLLPYTNRLADREVEGIFGRALAGKASGDDAARFSGHMLMELARMSTEDGLVMQLHAGSYRNHNTSLYQRFGADKGADIPIPIEFTRNLQPLLSTYGEAPNFTLIIYTLDESAYSRELAPLAGHYPAVKLGAPWWFFDSWNGMRRFKDCVMETAGLYNTAGFNDDTRAFLSIPVRHDLARRSDADWLAGLVIREVIDLEDAREMMRALAYELPRRAYKLDQS